MTEYSSDLRKVYAKTVRRRTPTFPSRWAIYFDLTPWGGGYIKAQGNGPGAVVVRPSDGTTMNLQTGEVYIDSRFKEHCYVVRLQAETLYMGTDKAKADAAWARIEYRAMSQGLHAQYICDGVVLQELEA